MNTLEQFSGLPAKGYTKTLTYLGHVESLREWLRTHPETQLVPIDPQVAWLYRGNLTGLLHHLKVTLNNHYIVMRTNGFTSIHDLRPEQTELYLPAGSVMDNVRRIWEQKLK